MRLPHSIRWRLMLWFGFLLGLLLAGFGVTGYQLQRLRMLAKVDDELANRLAMLGGELRQPGPPRGPRPRPPIEGDNPLRQRRPGGPRPDAPAPDGPNVPDGPRGGQDGPAPRPGGPPPGPEGFRPGPPDPLAPGEPLLPEAVQQRLTAGGYYFVVWGQDGAHREQANLPDGFELPPPPADDHGTRVATRTRDGFREAYHFGDRGAGMMVGTSVQPLFDELRAQQRWLWAAGLGVLALGLAGCWWIIVRSLRPISEIGTAARRIADGNLAERITIREPQNELGELAAVLNETFARLEESFSRQVRFTADASHELRTPLAMMISEAQAILARDRPASEYRESLENCHSAAQRMRSLVNSLLELARLDAKPASHPPACIDLGAFLANQLDELEPLARQAGCQLLRDLEEVALAVDESHLRLVINNLVCNAVHYNRPGGWVRVACGRRGDCAFIEVEDNGQGIAGEDLDRIFERFYRADPARSRAAGRFGLGLAICQAAVNAMGGSLRASSTPGQGSTFIVEVPCDEPAAPRPK